MGRASAPAILQWLYLGASLLLCSTGCARQGFNNLDGSDFEPSAVFATSTGELQRVTVANDGVVDSLRWVMSPTVVGASTAFANATLGSVWLRDTGVSGNRWQVGAALGDPREVPAQNFDRAEPYPFGVKGAFFNGGNDFMVAYAQIPVGFSYSIHSNGEYSDPLLAPDPEDEKVCWIELAVSPDGAEVTAAYAYINGPMAVSVFRDGAWIAESTMVMETRVRSLDAQGFDLAYEQESGDLMLVWASTTQPLMRWALKPAGSAMFEEMIQTDVDGATWGLFDLAPSPDGDSIALAALEIGNDSGNRALGGVWDGERWVALNTVDEEILDSAGMVERELVGVAWRQDTEALIAYPDSEGAAVVTWDGEQWGAPQAVPLSVQNVESVQLWANTFSERAVVMVTGDGSNLSASSLQRGEWSNLAWLTDIAGQVDPATLNLTGPRFR